MFIHPKEAHPVGSARSAGWALVFLGATLVWVAQACAGDDGGSPGFICNCDDGDPCTDDQCLPPDGACRHVPAEAELACLSDHHCNEADSCVVGTCEPFLGCGFSRCTQLPRTCDDGDSCTEDRCEDGVGCVFARIDEGAVCSADTDCEDDNACTDDVCVEFQGCGRFCEHRPNNCKPCESPLDCGAPCQVSTCVQGACVYEPADRFCDYQCFAPGTATVDIDSTFMRFRGIASPIDTDCDGCRCERELVLAGNERHLTMRRDSVEGPPWGTCQVETCGGVTTCTPLREGRGFMVSGPWLQSQGFVDLVPVGPYTMGIDYTCLAVHSDLMLGAWTMTLELEGGPTTRFDAVVVGADEGPTRFQIDGTDAGVGIPAQTLRLPNGAFRLDTSLETGLGTFFGPVFSGPTAIQGDLEGPDGKRAVLRIEQP